MDVPDDVHRKQGWLREEARLSGVELKTHDCETSWLEGVFARGDRSLCDVLERAYRNGARFDSWEETKKMALWEEAFAAEGVEVAKYLGTIPVTARLPWDHIDVGLEEGFLAREYRKALKSRLSPPCGKVAGAFVHATNVEEHHADQRKLVCYDCGVACDLSAMRTERLVYLRKLGAEKPRAPAPPPVVRTDSTRRPIALVQGDARRYRFLYTKLGASAFLSHLDLIRALPRAFRRLGVPLFYSQGFHPKPDMSFGPALSLGVSSLCEIVDVKIAADVDAASLVDELTRGAQDGMRFLDGARLGPRDAGVSRIVDAARYVVAIPRSVASEAWLAERVAMVREAKELPVVRRIDGIGKRVDVRSFLRSIDVGGEDARATIARARIAGDFVALEANVEIRGSGAVKIGEIVEVLGGELPHRAVRAAMGMWKDGAIASPMQLDAVRKDAPAAIEAQVAEDHAVTAE